MRHQSLVYSGVEPGAYDSTFGRTAPMPASWHRRFIDPPQPKPPPRGYSTPQVVSIANQLVEAFENRGKEAGLRLAASYRNHDLMEGAIEYVASRKLNASQLRQKLAVMRAKNLSTGGRHRAEYAFRRTLIQARLKRLEEGEEQAVADIPEIPQKEGTAPSWIPYLTLGIAVAGLVLAMGRKK